MTESVGERVLRGGSRITAVLITVAVATICGSLLAVVRKAAGDVDPVPSISASELATCPWLDATKSADKRTSMLLSAMTPVQEAELLHLYWGGSPANPYEGLSPAIPSLCLPAITEQDGSAGVASGWRTALGSFGKVTQLPAPIDDAAAFDPQLASEYGKVIGTEDAKVGIDLALAPTINIERDPRWGRAYESLGEDPFLTGSLAVPLIQGIQSQRVVSVVKHYAAYNQETKRGTTLDDVIVSDRALHEIYLPAWSTAIRQGRPGGVMCAYDLINGVPSCQSQALLVSQLRGAWGFDGFVRSDCGSVFQQSAAFAAGVSQVKCTRLYQPGAIAQAVSTGQLPRSELDALVRPVLRTLFRFDLVAAPHPARPNVDVSTVSDQAVALRAADEGAVLLKNDGLLPLAPDHLSRVALIGAEDGSPATAGFGAMRVHADKVVTALEAFEQEFGGRLTYADGADPAVAARLARGADVAIVVVHDVESEGRDRQSLTLSPAANSLVQAVAAANRRTVVVLETGSPAFLPWLADVGAVLETWYPGAEAGSSLVQLLTGAVDPSGKLPVTWPASAVPPQDPTARQFANPHGPTYYDEGLGVGYRWYEVTGAIPQFPFGYGLSYARFKFSDLHVTSTAHGGYAVTASVTNVGTTEGAEVAQCYVGFPASTGEPPRQLRGFQRVDLPVGQQAEVRFNLSPEDFSTWQPGGGTNNGTWSVTAGRYAVYVGDASDLGHLPLQRTIALAGASLGANGGPNA